MIKKLFDFKTDEETELFWEDSEQPFVIQNEFESIEDGEHDTEIGKYIRKDGATYEVTEEGKKLVRTSYLPSDPILREAMYKVFKGG